MIKIKIYTIGKNKETWLKEGLKEYKKRLSSEVALQWLIAKDDKALFALIKQEKNLICLEETGVLFSSEEFATFLQKYWLKEKAPLQFVIGGPNGIQKGIRAKASHIISLSKLTFTHQMTRLIFLEQLYRAIQIQKKTPYHRL